MIVARQSLEFLFSGHIPPSAFVSLLLLQYNATKQMMHLNPSCMWFRSGDVVFNVLLWLSSSLLYYQRELVVLAGPYESRFLL
jgi:hypothetical protein